MNVSRPVCITLGLTTCVNAQRFEKECVSKTQTRETAIKARLITGEQLLHAFVVKAA